MLSTRLLGQTEKIKHNPLNKHREQFIGYLYHPTKAEPFLTLLQGTPSLTSVDHQAIKHYSLAVVYQNSGQRDSSVFYARKAKNNLQSNESKISLHTRLWTQYINLFLDLEPNMLDAIEAFITTYKAFPKAQLKIIERVYLNEVVVNYARLLEDFSGAYSLGKSIQPNLQKIHATTADKRSIIAEKFIATELTIGGCAFQSQDFEAAYSSILTAESICLRLAPNNYKMLSQIHRIKGWYFFEQKNYKKALKEGQSSLDFYLKTDANSRNISSPPIYALIGEALNWLGDYKGALPMLKKGLSENTFSGRFENRSPLSGDLHLKIADAFQAINSSNDQYRNDDSSAYHYRQALYHYSNFFYPEDTTTLIPADHDLGNNSRMLRICLDNFTKVLLRKARKSNAPSDWQDAYRTQRLSVISLEDQRNRVGPDSRKIMAKLGRKTYEQAIGLAFEMAQAQNADSMYAIAFQWAEAAKAFELRMHLQDAEVALQAKAPDSLVREGRRLKLARNYYENEYQNLRRRPDADSTKLSSLEKQLYASQNTLREWEESMQDLIPTSLRKTEPEALSVTDIQSKLKPQEALLSFFYGDSAVYVFGITKSSLQAAKVGKTTEVDTLLRSLLTQLYQPSSLQDFTGPARQLYRAIFDTFTDIPHAKALLICPDGLMGYIPFSCLLTDDPPSANQGLSNSFRNLPYLQNKQSQRYAYGAALHFQQTIYDHTTNNLVAFAPLYEDELALAFSRPQAIAIADHWGGDVVLDEQAQEISFRNLTDQYQILHLAQHGEADLDQPLASRLLFSESHDAKPENDGFLHAYEIYALDIPARLVVLSSCESGYGPLAKGEGVMSLARAFRSAGAQSVLNTSWKVDGRVAMTMMQDFYTHLAKGTPISEALSNTSRDFLRTAPPELVHPHYWSAFTLIGADTPVPAYSFVKTTMPKLTLLVLIAAVFCVSLLGQKEH